MARLRPDDCRECFLKGCDCDCKTCVAARERNNRMTQKQLDELGLRNAWDEARLKGWKPSD